MNIKQPKGIILKIFGVTSSIHFQKQLNQYFSHHLSEYLNLYRSDAKLFKLINDLRNESLELNKENSHVPVIEDHNHTDTQRLIDYILSLRTLKT